MIDEKLREAEIIFEEVKKNAELRIALLKLDTVHYVAKLSANLITNIFTLICTLLAFLFGTVTLGFFFSDLLNSYALGFGGLTLFYALVAIFVTITKTNLIESVIINFTVRKFLNTRGNEDHNQ
ncbi:hypothetical protein EV200_104500 [Pedobacter psychrotolerans]|uniref:Uncharacterized protein n=1 Tax=Pedobacter psychrotolerans TaxID=1843235 RepID=A0A4R2HDB3_9SPHI|nr:hypothetical protein [Pedobacter psychrotolerans]TCO25462.1 hypothetical protein EV200_104500 [Pedobacter psychrotolerans]GGE45248.1 hypothetical protein GCM10011413_09250 [Pedobacter psychrotolerans]